jgi:hypothetical protein
MKLESTNKKKILSSLVKLIIKEFSLKSTLLFGPPDRGNIDILSDYSFFNKTITMQEVAPEYSIHLDDNADFIFGDLPLGLNINNTKQPFDFKLRTNWLIVFNLLKNLSDDGIGLFLLEPNFKQSDKGIRFLEELEKEGFYLNAIFNTPEKILEPATAMRPILGLFSKTASKKLFIAELNDEKTLIETIQNFKNKIGTNSTQEGEFLPFNKFESFSNHEISRQIKVLSSQYKDFKEFTLDGISLEVNLTKDNFKEKENAVYIPLVGTLDTHTDINTLTKKHQNYYQVIFDDKTALADYVKIYFNSELGQLTLSALSKGAYISRISKQDIEQIIVPLPALKQQRDIIMTDKQLAILEKDIFELRKELSLNPKNTELINEKIEGVLEVFGKLTDSDKIISLLRKGESKTVEFKETFSKDVRTGNKEKYIEESALKNIVAFLNSDGGDLLIGVSDNGEVIGVEKDIFITEDKYLLHFKNCIKEKIGEEFYPLIDYKLVSIEGNKILLVSCLKSDIPVFLDEKEFYVRTNPAADKLEGRKRQVYIDNHFKK